MIKGRFTVERTKQGDKELQALIEHLAPMIEPRGRMKMRDDESKPYRYLYATLYAPEEKDRKYL